MSSVNIKRNRKHDSRYAGMNGFTDHVRSCMQGEIIMPNVHIDVESANTAFVTSPERGSFRDAVEQRMFAEDMLQLRGTYFPGLAKAKETIARPETSASVQERIVELQKRHANDLRTLFEWQAEDHHNDALDRYQAKDGPASDNDKPDILLESFYRMSERGSSTQFDDAFSALQYAHTSTVLALQRLHSCLEKREEETRLRRDSYFPSDVAKYREVRSKDVQLRIARFLLADKITKERMLTEFGWAWRQVQNLIGEYERNASFRGEVQRCMHNVEAHDPRRRLSLANVS